MKVLAAFVLLAVFVITGAAAQTAAPVARTPDGQPDIQGYWTEQAGGPEAVNVENGFQTADSLRVQGWTDAQLAACPSCRRTDSHCAAAVWQVGRLRE